MDGLTGSELNNISPVSFTSLGDVINEFVKYAFPAAGLLVLLYFLYGGYEVMLSGGNPKTLEAGKSKITNAIIGFVIIFISYWIVQAVEIALGLDSVGPI